MRPNLTVDVAIGFIMIAQLLIACKGGTSSLLFQPKCYGFSGVGNFFSRREVIPTQGVYGRVNTAH